MTRSKTTSLRLLLVAAGLVLSAVHGTVLAQAPQPATQPAGDGQRRVMIVPFENLSSRHDFVEYQVEAGGEQQRHRAIRVDRYSESPRGTLEDALAEQEGLTILERKRVDSILQEQEFGALKGLADPATAVAAGKMLGATTIIMGSILEISETKKAFHGDGIDVEDLVTTAAVRVRAIDIATGRVLASKTFTGEHAMRITNFGGKVSSDGALESIKAAMALIPKDEKFMAKVVGEKAVGPAVKTVKVNIAPTPANSDVTIDGNYVGSSPTTVDLPEGARVVIELQKAGFAPWRNSVMPRDGMNISPELEKKAAP